MKNNKALGQHWLKNREILDQIADVAAEESAYQSSETKNIEFEKPEICVEIGPGLGTLTSSLLRRFNKVIAIEYDERLAFNLPNSFPGKNLEVVNTDVLDYNFDKITEPYVVAGNIPYYITSPIIEKLLKLTNQPTRIVLLIQKEVAERITSDKETQLSLFVKNHAFVTAGPVVNKNEFTPPPKVDSQIIIMDPHPPIAEESVFDLIRLGFQAPRKKLIHNLSSLYSKDNLIRAFKDLDLSLDVRPGDLDLGSWQDLKNILSS